LKPLVIGLGNRLRGDDAAGLEVATIVGRQAPQASVVTCEREPSDLIDLWDGVPLAIVVDAVEGGKPGDLHRMELEPSSALPVDWPLSRTASTHALDLPQVVGLAQSLGRLPQRLVVLGIAGEEFVTGGPLSTGARAGVEAAVRAVLTRLDADLGLG
jgi:hydrogenase maturation protease